MFCCTLLYVHSSIAIILMGKRELIALLNLSSWCLVMVERLFLAVPRGCLQFVIVVFPDHTHLLFSTMQRLRFIFVCTQVVINARTSMCRATYCIICKFVIGAVMLNVSSESNARMAWLKLIVVLIWKMA